MDGHSAARAASKLLQARRNKQQIEALPTGLKPADLRQAYAIQAASLAGILEQAGGGTRVGHKIGCTNETAQRQLGLTEPFAGALLSPFVHTSPATLPSDAFFMRVLEPEVAFRLGTDLPAAGAPYSADRVARSVATVMGAIEIVDSRYTDWTTIGAPHLIAGNASAGHWVHGPESTEVDSIDYVTHPVVLSLNGEVRERGVAGNALGSSLNALAWLANELAKRGRGLSADQLVTTGTTTVVVEARPGDSAEADFGPLGKVYVRFD